MAGRILGMGDVVTLVERAQEQFNAEEAAKMQQKMMKGTFGFDDFLKQMQTVKKMGGMADMLKMIPGMGSKMAGLDIDDSEMSKIEGIIHSMTLEERKNPDIISPSRRRRIAAGCGRDQHDVSALIKTFERSRDMLKALSGGALGGFKTLLSGGGMDAIGSMMSQGKKIKQRSRRKQKIVRKGKITYR
jgi:signal recognition particle subunit SRP54